MKKLALIATTCLAGLTLAACGNQHHSSKGADSSSATSKTVRSSSQKSGSSSVSQSSSSAAASSSSAAVHLTGGRAQSTTLPRKWVTRAGRLMAEPMAGPMVHQPMAVTFRIIQFATTTGMSTTFIRMAGLKSRPNNI